MNPRWRGWPVGFALLALSACHAPKPLELVETGDVDTHWAVDSSVGETHYLAPVVRFRVRNKSQEDQGSIQATATFRRVGEESVTWGADFRQVSTRREPLRAGQDGSVMLKSDARYFSTGDPQTMFQHAQFRDAKVEVYLRVGSSGWTKFLDVPVERRIGARSVQSLPGPESPPAAASPGSR
jgi:hypothetical protein